MTYQSLFYDEENLLKECPECHEIKHVSAFNRHKGRKLDAAYHCKECKRAIDKRYRETAPEKIQNTKLKRLYGITKAEYDQILQEQGFKCAICESNESGSNWGDGKLHVDHVNLEKNKIVRGLLCSNCNTGLGKFRDQINLLEKAIEYLKKTHTLLEIIGDNHNSFEFKT